MENKLNEALHTTVDMLNKLAEIADGECVSCSTEVNATLVKWVNEMASVSDLEASDYAENAAEMFLIAHDTLIRIKEEIE